MSSSRLLALALAAALGCAMARVEAAPPNKCVVNGTVTYQQGPCASAQTRKQPTLEELNAAEKQRRAAAVATKTEQAPPAPSPAPPVAVRAGDFRCDGRQYCSQMTSCAEAKYFLLNCPGVKMDGDHNGVPCEKQWCAR